VPSWQDIQAASDELAADIRAVKDELVDRGYDEDYGFYGKGWVWVDKQGGRLTPAQAMKEPAFKRLPLAEQSHIRRLADESKAY
jgi:hypothetical protein